MTKNESPEWLQDLLERLSQLGFVAKGIAPAVDSEGITDLVRWIDHGYAAGMDYFADRLNAYRHPDGVMPGTKSILVLAYPYPADLPENHSADRGRVARYAWPGTDYHDTIHAKLKTLKRFVNEHAPTISVRGCVDTAPLMERELAVLAGLGWRGKNTLLLSKGQGSYFFLATLLFDVALPYDAPMETSHCGTCTACLDECPTDAFPQPGVMDASRCISYLTIEHRGAIPEELRTGIGEWLFGCDVCQEVCPWNRKATRLADTDRSKRVLETVELTQFFEMDEGKFRERFRKTPFWRTRLQGMKRNAAIVLGNKASVNDIETLQKASLDEDAVVAEACRWAIAEIKRRHNQDESGTSFNGAVD